MPIDIPPSLVSLTVAGVSRFAKIWHITRTDGVEFFLTDHDHDLVVDGETYLSAAGFDGSAKQKQQGTKSQNLEIKGIISSDLLTSEDLRVGKFRDAQVTEATVDWRYPWAGKFLDATYYIDDVSGTGEYWTANIVGITSLLRARIGRKFTRTCDVKEFGDARCGYNVAATSTAGTVGTVIDNRRQFQTSLSNPRGYFNLGKLTWTSGDNNGLISLVKNSLLANGRISLQLRSPYDIQTSDTFTVVRGCPHTFEFCKSLSNQANFRGFPTIPGNDALITTPTAH